MNTGKALSLIIFLGFFLRIAAQDSLATNRSDFGSSFDDYVSYSTPSEYQIAGIRVSGVEFLDNTALIHLTGLAVGQNLRIPGDKINQAMEKLWKQGLFENIQIKIEAIEGKRVFLEIILEERARLGTLAFEGLSRAQITKVKEDISVKEGDIITDYKISLIEKSVKKILLDKSYLEAKVFSVLTADTVNTNQVVLTLHVNKGPKVKIEKIEIEGNIGALQRPENLTFWNKIWHPIANVGNKEKLAFPDNKIRRKLKKTKQIAWWRFWKKSKYVPTTFKEDQKTLIQAYNKEGYRDARIITDSMYTVKPGRIGIKLRLYEGHPYYFGNVSFIGNKKYTEDQLKMVLAIKKGDIFNEERFTKNLMMNPSGVDVLSLYYDDGYLMVNVTPVETNVYGDTVDMEIRIFEGPQSRFNQVLISGNTRTNDHVILREMRTVPGQLFSRTDIINSQNELRQMRFFNDQTINQDISPNEDGSTDLTYIVEEVGSDQLELSGGWGAGMIVGTIGVSFNNFSLKNIFRKDRWKPLPSGDGQKLSLRATSNGTYYYAVSASFTEPWLGGKKPLALSVSYNHSRQTTGYSRKETEKYGTLTINGFSLGLGQRLKWPDDFFTLYQAITYQQYNTHNWSYDVLIPSAISNNINYSITLSRQSLDASLFPTTGSTLALTLQATPPYSLFGNKNYAAMNQADKYRWLEFYKINFKMGFYFNPFDKLVINARMRMGYMGFYNKDIGYSPYERFFLGGDGLTGMALDGRELVGLRGYENNSLSPTTGASAYNKITLELRYPITNKPMATIYALAFAEAGNSWGSAHKFDPFSYYKSAGVGVRLYLSAMGMFGLDWGYGFDPVPGKPNANKSHFHFSINQSLDW